MTENLSTNKFGGILEFNKKLDELSIQHPEKEIVRITDTGSWSCKLQLGPFCGKAEAKTIKVSKRLAYQDLEEQMQKGGVFDTNESLRRTILKNPKATNQPEYQRQTNSEMHAVPPAYPSMAQLQPITHSAAVQYCRGSRKEQSCDECSYTAFEMWKINRHKTRKHGNKKEIVNILNGQNSNIIGAVEMCNVSGSLGKHTTRIVCKNCRKENFTRVEGKVSGHGMQWAIACCCVGNLYLSLLVFCIDGFREFTHYCPACNAMAGKYNPSFSGEVSCVLLLIVVGIIALEILLVVRYLVPFLEFSSSMG